MYIMFLNLDESIVLKDMLQPSYALLCGGANQEVQDHDHSNVNSWLQMPEQGFIISVVTLLVVFHCMFY